MTTNDFTNSMMLDRLARLRSQNIVKDVWPDRHIVGPDGTPVPFHIAQNEIFDSERRTVALVGGSQLGKTTLAPWWLYREIKLRGSGDYIAATSSFDLFRLKLLPSLLQVFEEILQLGRYWVGDKVFELKDPVTGKFLAQRATDHMWGRIILRSAQSLSGLESATAKGAILDEAGQDEFPIEAWRAILRRLTLHRGRILLTTTLYNCYDETTEIYTRNGWKTFGNLDDSDEVFACDATGVGDFEKPERIYWSRYSGKMINLLGGRINLCVTPNHRVPYYNHDYCRIDTAEHFIGLGYGCLSVPKTISPRWGNTEFFKLPAVEIRRGKTYSETTKEMTIPMREWCAFLGWFLSEGSAKGCRGGKIRNSQYRITISQNRGEKRDIIRQDLQKLPFKFTETDYGFEISNKQLWSYLLQLGSRSEKYIPHNIKMCGKDNLLVLIDRMVLGDGTYKRAGGEFAYYTTSPRLADDFREICMLCGVSCLVYKVDNHRDFIDGNPVKSTQPIYHIIQRHRKRATVKSHNTIDYDGYIGCVTVSTGLVLVRRGGEEIISGNTGWIHSEIINPAIKGGTVRVLELPNDSAVEITDNAKAGITVVQADSIINPTFPLEEYNHAKETLPADLFAMFYRGRTARPRFMIYDCFDEEKNTMPRFSIPAEWNRFIGADFGMINTWATYWAQDPDNKKLYCYRTYHGKNRTAAEHVEEMLEGESGGRPLAYGGAKAEGQWRDEFRNAGLPIKTPKFADVWLGINVVYGMLKNGELIIFDDQRDLIDDILSYRRKTDNLGNPTDEIVGKSTFHCADTLRYGPASVKSDHKVLIGFA